MKFLGYCLAIGIGLAFLLSRPSEPVESHASNKLTESSPEYINEITRSFNEMADSYEELSHVTLDGSILDVHYNSRVSDSQFRIDVSGIAISFSKEKLELLGVSGVTVRAVYDGYIMAQASARKGEVTSIE